ncbi:ABC transporter ATP-binding protein [Microbacteriaceae bacterium 4G12]
MLQVDLHQAGYTDTEVTIRDIGFSIAKGEMAALIGANGAGKSTTIKAILGLLPYVKGRISFLEESAPYAYVPEQPTYYDYLTLWEHIELLAAARGFAYGSWEQRAEELLHIFRMTDSKHHYLSKFSKGMKQKAMLIFAFLAKPDFYIVDEPFIGLDPTAVRDFLILLHKERERGAGVLLCTHVLDTAEKICERFLVISDGTLLADGNLETIRDICQMPDGSLMDCFDAIVRKERYE